MDFLNGGGMLAIMGYFGYILKDIPNRILALILPRYTVSLAWDNASLLGSENFSISNKWLFNFDKSGTLSQHIQRTDTHYNTDREKVNIIVDGTYYIFPSMFNMAVITAYTQKTSDSNATSVNRFVTVTFYGTKRYEYKKAYEDSVIDAYKETENKYLTIGTVGRTGGSYNDYPKRPFETVFSKYNDEIKDVLDRFIENEDFYKEHGFTHKLGMLFYGPPGSGKSTIVRAIASYINWRIIYVNIADVDITNITVGQKSIILFEDIDCISLSRDDKKANETTLQTLLNYIDGPLSPNDVIFVATTNHIENLDPALIRKGRFDYQYHIDYIDREAGEDMCKLYNVDLAILKDIEFPVSPAVIQNEILYLKTAGTNDSEESKELTLEEKYQSYRCPACKHESERTENMCRKCVETDNNKREELVV